LKQYEAARPRILVLLFLSCIVWVCAGLYASSDTTNAGVTPFVSSEGELAWALPVSTLEGSAEWLAGCRGEAWQAGLGFCFEENAWKTLSLEGAVTWGGAEITSSVVIDVQTPSFTFAESWLQAEWDAYRMTAIAHLEEKGCGFRITLRGGRETLIRRLRLNWNLSPYHRDPLELEEETFSPTLTQGDVYLNLHESANAFMRWTDEGFEFAGLRLRLADDLFWGLRWFGTLFVRTDESKFYTSPSLHLEPEPGFSLYAGPVWDRAASTLSGIKFYGFSFYGELGSVEFRSITALVPELELVKEPYWELVGFIWEMSGCCTEEVGEASVAFFFGGDSLFDLGEIDFESEIPLWDNFSVHIDATFTTFGEATLTLGWEAEF
jgi:hypothetical protein